MKSSIVEDIEVVDMYIQPRPRQQRRGVLAGVCLAAAALALAGFAVRGRSEPTQGAVSLGVASDIIADARAKFAAEKRLQSKAAGAAQVTATKPKKTPARSGAQVTVHHTAASAGSMASLQAGGTKAANSLVTQIAEHKLSTRALVKAVEEKQAEQAKQMG
jgi:hypothetical protein